MSTDSRPPDTAWLNGRVANAMHSPLAILLASCVIFVAALVLGVIVPRQARQASLRPVSVAQHLDTTALLLAASRVRSALDDAEEAVAAAQDTLVVARTTVRDTLSPALRARRDSLSQKLASLNRLLARVANAPLPASYRALAQSPALRTNPKAAALADTLSAIERERDDFGAIGGVDPIFVALTARAGMVGRSITDLAEKERARLRDELGSLRQSQPQRDTLSPSIAATFMERARDSLERELDSADQRLAVVRQANRGIDSASARAREIANVVAPPVALLVASAVLAIIGGFGFALARELYAPTIATSHEAERTSGVRVIAVVLPRRHRVRHDDDRSAPHHLVDRDANSYRRLYLYLAGSKATLAMVTVTGQDGDINAVVAANIAAAASGEGRGTVVVDADLSRSAIAAIFGTPSEPGLADVIAGTTSWPEAIEPVAISRDLTLDVLPAGRTTSSEISDQDADRVRRDLARMARRYDVMIVNAHLAHVSRGARSLLPAPDVLLCVRIGETKLRDLARSIALLRAAGTRVMGLVLWSDEDPRIPPTVFQSAAARTERGTRAAASSSG